MCVAQLIKGAISDIIQLLVKSLCQICLQIGCLSYQAETARTVEGRYFDNHARKRVIINEVANDWR